MSSLSPQVVKDRLETELERLFGLPVNSVNTEENLTDSRLLILELSKPGIWSPLAVVWHAFVSDWGMPAPAIVINGSDGIQLWFSLTQPAPIATCTRLLMGLRSRFLNGLAYDRVTCFPGFNRNSSEQSDPSNRVPACVPGTDHWSAFVTRDLAAVFGDEPWVDVPPVRDQQAEILSRLSSMTPAHLDFVVGQLESVDAASPNVAASDREKPLDVSDSRTGSGPPQEWRGPAEFLWATMNNASLPMGERIEAAKALLPYPETHWKQG